MADLLYRTSSARLVRSPHTFAYCPLCARLTFTSSALHASVRTKGNGDVVRALIANGADVNARTQYGNSALHLAASGGHENAARWILAASADVNARCNPDGGTPLHRAVEHGHAALVSLLLQHGALKDQHNCTGLTPVHLAEQKKKGSVVDALAAETGNAVRPPVCGWTRSGQLDEFGSGDVQVRTSLFAGAGLGTFCTHKPRPIECKPQHPVSCQHWERDCQDSQ